MTGADWLACDDTQKMLAFLRDRTSDRKLRLFACACCRRVWQRLTDEDCYGAIEVAERYAEGLGGSAELEAAWATAAYAADHASEGHADSSVCGATDDDAWMAAHVASADAARAFPDSEEERAIQQLLLRCIFGNPFRPIPLDLSWRTPTVASLAQCAYDERRLPSGDIDAARLAVLSDALEEAGCTESELLAHLRSPGPHARGCWAIDLLLGKS